MIDYGQFCTVARGAEVLGERWTPLVMRELLCGSRRFNDIRRGVPRMSADPADAAAAQARGTWASSNGAAPRGAWEYHLTPAGEELRPDRRRPRALGRALDRQPAEARPARRRLPDVGHPALRAARLVPARTARRDPLLASPTRRAASARGGWWSRSGAADLCRDDPGLDVDVSSNRTLRALTEIWTGDSDPAVEAAAGRLRVHGAGRNGQRLWHWLGRSMFAVTRSNAQCEATSRDHEPAERSSIEASGDAARRA